MKNLALAKQETSSYGIEIEQDSAAVDSVDRTKPLDVKGNCKPDTAAVKVKLTSNGNAEQTNGTDGSWSVRFEADELHKTASMDSLVIETTMSDGSGSMATTHFSFDYKS